MEFLAGAFGTWLLEQLADAGRRRLAKFGLGDDLQRAMRSVATDAIHLTAGQFCPADSGRASSLPDASRRTLCALLLSPALPPKRH
jgi:hypothetical protein